MKYLKHEYWVLGFKILRETMVYNFKILMKENFLLCLKPESKLLQYSCSLLNTYYKKLSLWFSNFEI